MTIAYRPAEIDDAQFVVSMWSRCYKDQNSSGMITDEDWAPVMHVQIQKVVARPEVQTIIAYENTDPTFLYGFISFTAPPTQALGNAPIVYFMAVKEAYRRGGFARGLLAAAGIDPSQRFVYTCWTTVLGKVDDKIPFAKHRPGFARKVGYVEEEPRRDRRWKP